MAIKPGTSQMAAVTEFLGLRTDTPPSKCPTGYSPDCADMVFSPGGMATRNPLRKDVTISAEVVYRKEFLAKDGTTQVLALDVNGRLYVVRADGSFVWIDTVTPGARCNSVTAYGREYMAFFNEQGGCDDPRQWDGKNLYRVSQGGPGACATFAPAAITGDQYDISSITQPLAQSRGFSYFLQSDAVGSTDNAGTNVTIYYSDATQAGPDDDLVNAFNSGQPVYVYVSFSGTPQTLGPWTVRVTSVGQAQPPGQPRNFDYFTFTLPTIAKTYYAGSGNGQYTANYQRTLATMTMVVDVPSLEVGDTASIAGASIAGYDGSQTITQTPTSANLIITQTALSAGTATYKYIILTGTAPVAGQLVTIADTLNANGVLNGTNMTIASASGGNSGTFTVDGFTSAVHDAVTVSESGTGQTAGSIFNFDPGAVQVGSVASPIYGASAGGTLTFGGSASTIASGKRQGVVFFILEDGTATAPSPIAKFTIPANTNAISFDNLPIGPPNVKARGIAFTGANGGKFFFLPIVPQINGVILGTSTVINDNYTTSGTVHFTDEALFGGIALDEPGNNQFAQVALNLPRGVDWYGDRLLWIGEKNTVSGLLNMGMDGGTVPGNPGPLGWNNLGSGNIQQDGTFPVYVVSGPGMGQITQPAYQTADGVEIIQPRLSYMFRVWLKPGATAGQMEVLLYSPSTAFASTATIQMSAVTHAGYYTVPFNLAMPDSIPSDLTLSISYTGLAGDAKARQFQIIYADNPNRNPIARFSYTENPAAYDALTGNAGPNDDATELRATVVLQESLYFITERALYRIQQIGNTEPSSWEPEQIAQNCGAFDANSTITGKGWIAWAGPEGVFWFSGGLPEKISSIIAPTWRQIAGITNLLNDSDHERVYFGVVDAQGGKSALVYDYHEIGIGGSGKWTRWNRPFDWFSASAAGTVFTVGAKFFHLDTTPGTDDDDLGPIGGYYLFAPLASSMFRKQFSYMGLEIAGSGTMTPFVFTKTPNAVTYTLRAQDLAALGDVVAEYPGNITGRLLYLKIGQPGVQFQMQNLAVVYQPDPNQPLSGAR